MEGMEDVLEALADAFEVEDPSGEGLPSELTNRVALLRTTMVVFGHKFKIRIPVVAESDRAEPKPSDPKCCYFALKVFSGEGMCKFMWNYG